MEYLIFIRLLVAENVLTHRGTRMEYALFIAIFGKLFIATFSRATRHFEAVI